ncbi:MAG: sigma-70 family RNA polymerase sigma factor [Acidobacteria bacterium]|nr:sigma-70 family RNA polymerase sigma factor [Acidobacteriota bacterium]
MCEQGHTSRRNERTRWRVADLGRSCRDKPSPVCNHPATDAAHHELGVSDPTSNRRVSAEDEATVERLLAGDEATFTDLVERYHGRLLRLALLFVSDRASAEEVVQDTWLAVITGLPAFEGRSGLKTWIFSILSNRAKTRGRREKRSVPFSALTSADQGNDPAVDPSRFTSGGGWSAPPEKWDEDTPERLLLRQETRAAVDAAILALPAAQRAVITLRDVEGVDSAEVCNILEISDTNQRVLLHRARAKVRTALEQHVGSSR